MPIIKVDYWKTKMAKVLLDAPPILIKLLAKAIYSNLI